MKKQLKDVLHYYLGTGLKCTHYVDFLNPYDVVELNSLNYGYLLNNGKPFLRPLSSLTKLITVEGYNNGEPFVPYKELGWVLNHNECGIGEILDFGDAHSGTVNVIDYLDSLELLLKWHFNVFNIDEIQYIEIKD